MTTKTHKTTTVAHKTRKAPARGRAAVPAKVDDLFRAWHDKHGGDHTNLERIAFAAGMAAAKRRNGNASVH